MIENFNQALLAYAKTRDPAQRYKTLPAATCALGQFVKSLGYTGELSTYCDVEGKNLDYPDAAKEAAFDYEMGSRGHNNWGDLVKRLEALLS